MGSVNAFVELGAEWEHVKPLGSGSFGTVQLFRHQASQALFAVKFVERGELVDEAIKKEVINHCMLCHENIARFREVILRPRHLAIVMEFAQGGDLFNAVQQAKTHKMNEPMARYFFQQLIAGIGYMHSQGMCHRDLKLENLLLSDNPPKLKICDFGYSKSSKWQSQAKSKVGTAAYIAPEVITASKGSKYDAEAVDVWSSGVVLHTMLLGMYPFCDTSAPNDETRTIRHILAFWKGEIPYNPPPSCSKECVDLLRRMLTANPEKRMNILDITEHPWFRVNLPRGCSINPSPPSDGFYQQPLEEIQKTLEAAVKPTVGQGPLAEVPEHSEWTGEDGPAMDRQNSDDASILTPNPSITLADSGIESVMMTAASLVDMDDATSMGHPSC
mmetsp:Transcript_25849/g.49104  ORF Transcript_25849/g.49104 Transcript_25849/m.49104 type:complete len:387 (+) Transcript_25849:259-1419(+)|eukprot:CAMPEP_0114245858 /NCGR_PEP_ID=MMETSP0058-20121206/12136_1 /TAXON_ID=36894 /ORGANISM="Pyramimonas parkeae, CCMP726" /LENGTH=386 /DNA_ID=CAMNT_0001358971 /DNA_START=228 /DNA_END=1388 /DNA_ORIENTATION=+